MVCISLIGYEPTSVDRGPRDPVTTVCSLNADCKQASNIDLHFGVRTKLFNALRRGRRPIVAPVYMEHDRAAYYEDSKGRNDSELARGRTFPN